MFKCAHISDVHFRSLKRHNEYKTVFKKVFEKLKEVKELDAIFIGGDIVHSKTQGITPELIDILNWWFTSIAEIAPTYVILGNHDGLILNEDRQDAITPIVNALNNKNIYLYKKSGVYPLAINKTGLPINWCVFSCFDEKNWNSVKPVENEINIACFHGAVTGSKTDVDWELEGEVQSSFFDNYDFGFLGDIHKKQYLDVEKRIAYPGSTIQQNYGEDISKGFLLWEINSKNDFKSKFIRIENPHPFLTLDWKGNVEETLVFASKVKKQVRFRVRSNYNISQAEIKIIHNYLKNEKNAKEIVYQINNTKTNKSSSDYIENSQQTLNIRNKQDRKQLVNDYFEEIDQETIDKIDNIFVKTLDKIPQDLKDIYGQKWSVNSLKFDNTFSYGKNNVINFDNMNGIIGLFGNNRSGKSSIPGTLMYTLFNTTDRGSLKNQDIVNIRKGFCKASADITIGTEKYTITRETTKKTSKKNETSATTKLTLKSANNLVDETEEQRRETEKILKKLIGSPEDFLYTSFASQGDINTFIKEKNSARKSILSKFLNIQIYEELYKQSRDEYSLLKSLLNSKEEKNWDLLVLENKNNILLNKRMIDEKQEFISKERKRLINLNVELENVRNNNKKHKSGHNKTSANKEKNYLIEKLDVLNNKNENLKTELDYIKSSLHKINEFKNSFSIEDLNSEKERLNNLEKKLSNFKSSLSVANKNKVTAENEIKILDQVPCGDMFKNCKFIEKAHNKKEKINEIKTEIIELEANVFEINGIVRRLKENQINEKILKYENILKKEYKLSIDLENINTKITFNEKEISSVLNKIENIDTILEEIKELNIDQTDNKEIEIRQKINELQQIISNNEVEVLNLNKNIFSLDKEIICIEKEKEEYYKIIEEFRVNDIFSTLVSKRGIPTMIINSYLPKINQEINSILNGVTSFKIYLEEEEKNNNLNVYIDYGDSKRIIECASGMEKMMASIAIRVALVNISSLAKSDIFIIDEGFGALDDTNIEACSRLLNSLKKYFKSIIIISHIDAIKDIVDKNIEIGISGNDSYVRFE
jgi:exonuclease SbcC